MTLSFCDSIIFKIYPTKTWGVINQNNDWINWAKIRNRAKVNTKPHERNIVLNHVYCKVKKAKKATTFETSFDRLCDQD